MVAIITNFPNELIEIDLNENVRIAILSFGFENLALAKNSNAEKIVIEFLKNNKERILKKLYSKVFDKELVKLLNDLKTKYKIILYVSCLVRFDDLKFVIEHSEIEFEKYNVSLQIPKFNLSSFIISYDKEIKNKLLLELI